MRGQLAFERGRHPAGIDKAPAPCPQLHLETPSSQRAHKPTPARRYNRLGRPEENYWQTMAGLVDQRWGAEPLTGAAVIKARRGGVAAWGTSRCAPLEAPGAAHPHAKLPDRLPWWPSASLQTVLLVGQLPRRRRLLPGEAAAA